MPMTLYIVGTPIGNLEDISLRALRVLREVSLIAAEDTRHTRKLLQRYEITTPLTSYHEHSSEARVAELLAALALGDVALVSDAGMPGISDPGYDLVRACIAQGIAVTPIPGPSAPVTALVASGLPSDRYCFLGFLPRKATERRTLLAAFARLPATLVAFEAPHRLIACLGDLLAVLGDRQLVVARELTKLHEELVRGRCSEAIAHFQQQRPRGEITLVIEGAHGEETRRPGDPETWKPGDLETRRPGDPETWRPGDLETWSGVWGVEQPADEADSRPLEQQIAERLRELRAEGLSGSAAARQAAKEFGVGKSLAYEIWVGLDDGSD